MKVLTVAKRSKVFWNRSLVRSQDSARQAEKTIRQLRRSLGKEYRKNVGGLYGISNQPQQAAALCEVLLFLSRTQAEIDGIRRKGPVTTDKALSFTREAVEEILDIFQHQPSPLARTALADALKVVSVAQGQLPLQIPSSKERMAGRTILIHTELLYQGYGMLFPAERMMVAAGRTADETSTLTALFDVTGNAHSANVRADADRLARALIAMEATDSFLLGWIHSHPGNGAGATIPSSIDRRQQKDWIRDYSQNLLGIIMVEDGYFRLWGSAVEEGKVQVVLSGGGIQESEEENVWRLVQ